MGLWNHGRETERHQKFPDRAAMVPHLAWVYVLGDSMREPCGRLVCHVLGCMILGGSCQLSFAWLHLTA
jgi:hypothetical protein